MSGGLQSAVAIITRWAMLGATLALVAMTLLVVLSALTRYLIGAPFGFTEELVGLLFAAMAFLVWPMGALRGEHIAVSFVSERLPSAARRWTGALSFLAILVFCFVFGKDSYRFAATTLKLNAKSDVAGIALFPWMALIPLTCVLILCALVCRWAGAHRGHKPTDLDDSWNS